MKLLRTLPLLLALSACGASVTPLQVASATIDVGRSALSLRCTYSTPACDKARLVLNDVIATYNVALEKQALGQPGGEQAVADAAVAVLRTIESLLPTVDADAGASDGGAQ